jgi:dTDP-4-dehydrorhamnose reductase
MILITGITGLLGTALVKQENKGRDILGLYLGDYAMQDSKSIRYRVCDICDKDKLFGLVSEGEVEYIIHMAGLANVDVCEREQVLGRHSNVDGTNNICELAKLKNAKLVYVSSNAVFDGENPPYSEEDEPNPINRYGAMKLECEALVKERLNDFLIVRPIIMYGLNNPNERSNFVLWVLDKMRQGEKINIVTDVYENPLLSNQCADIVWQLIDSGKTGTYHIAGNNIISRYEAALQIAKVFDMDASLINPVLSEFFTNLALRPKNTSYNTQKIKKELNVELFSFEEGCRLLKEQVLLNERSIRDVCQIHSCPVKLF